MPDVVIVLTTVPVGELGDTIATTLVTERLAACVNVCAPMTSVFRWEGRVTTELERQLVIKTTVDRIEAVIECVRRLHPYELPELLVCRVTAGTPDYLDWVHRESAPSDP